MRNPWHLGVFSMLVLVAAVRCSSDDEGSITGDLIETKSITVGGVEQQLMLGTVGKSATVVFPAGVTRAMTMVQVNLNENVRKRAATVTAPTVEIATRGLAFEAPAKMRQTLPPPPAGKQYVAVTAQREGDAWMVKRGGARVVMGGAAADAGTAPIAADAGASPGGLVGGTADGGVDRETLTQSVAPEGGMLTYEIDVTGTGYWAIGIEVTEPTGGSVGAGCPAALNKLKGCGFSFMPANIDPCATATGDVDTCVVNCITTATCPQLEALYCSSMASPNFSDPLIQCVFNCENARQGTPIACGDEGESYTERDRCDGFADCSDGADETGCPPPAMFACGDGTTTLEENRCDDFADCANGADEAGCPPEADLYCPNGMEAGFGSSEESSSPGTTSSDLP